MLTSRKKIGDLERAVMDVLWNAEDGELLTVREVHALLADDRDIAYTTVMTVMDRLARKGMVEQLRNGRAYTYRARSSRGEMTAELMRGTLDEFAEHDRRTALAAFVGVATDDDIDALRQALAELERR
ncbi:BlaI/MecI/CopY family transcriptional regulator [Nocardioides sp. Bht2]|uniref:BlaI/MecI/CopY family transcriptional regulator n=1 Tax=Nocardioides sp. Bht2 TaxID=3392297 RepID=UPI0039B3732B